MPKLPRVFQPVLKLIACPERSRRVSRFALVTLFFLFSLFTLPLLASLAPSGTLTRPALAAEPPAPQPCQNAKFDEDKLTDNWLTEPDGEPPITVIIPEVLAHQPVFFQFEVDFSKLSALFGPANSNYLEGNYQDKDHKAANISQLDAAGISKFHGAGQKAAPKAMLDPLKVETVKYIYEKNTLAESADVYTDFNGREGKTIYEMRNAFGEPDPETQRGTDQWENGWGKYWDKIPTTYSEFYEGRIIFKYAREENIQRVINGEYCPDELPRQITFVMPEFFRTTAITGQLNQIVVPKVAQSDHSNDIVLNQNNPTASQGVLGKIISICSKFLKDNPVSNALEKVISRLPNIFNPVGKVYAEESEGCIKILGPGKESQDPYCALPADQLQGDDRCNNQTDQFKRDTENQNVKCTFYIAISESAGTYGIWPVFRIPLITEQWNNALFSDQTEPSVGSIDSQVTNRPGVYSWSTPRVVFENKLKRLLGSCDPSVADPLNDPSCTELVNLASRLTSCNPEEDPNSSSCQELDSLGIPLGEYVGFKDCVEQPGSLQNWERQILVCAYGYIKTLSDLKKEPGEVEQNNPDNAKERFVGGVNCAGPHQNQDVNFLPKAAQEVFGITNECPVQAVAQLPDTGSGPGPPPGNVPPTQDNCFGKWFLDNPVGNFGDPLCDFGEEKLYNLLQQLDPANAAYWFYTIVPCEAPGYNVNAFNPNSTSGEAFGLYQMGHQAYPQYGLDYQIGDGATNGYDRGDVKWDLQTSNAINWNKTYLGEDFSYWGCAQ
ncbi:hypothetical protein A3A60_02980 [Candidatus Curtissbacteria bacterium RIFCSPLOWO2_01_FULL_42_26]|uniref:Uncharacterized protein n=1 Tax=Candidatus Curtissbacteria bacterium RIFCSPLOWO2_01_FULL_42_26 TaxID=1797729 RepID=A0A1F5I270_9BACT|nr:MAG: hypothetical protein A3A60_02980 [Candidatus Curtissbacteria bacterium RIFCSPLOWO2_01_FULL_42_26]